MNYRQTFVEANGPEPWPCNFCGEDLTIRSLLVHHIDEDRSNNDKSNLVATHISCHTRHHRSDVPKSIEHRAKLSAANQGKILTLETRTKISAALKGKPKSDETRINMSAAQLGHSVSDEARMNMSMSHKGKSPSNKGVFTTEHGPQRFANIGNPPMHEQRKECECGMTSNPAAISRHAKVNGHTVKEVCV